MNVRVCRFIFNFHHYWGDKKLKKKKLKYTNYNINYTGLNVAIIMSNLWIQSAICLFVSALSFWLLLFIHFWHFDNRQHQFCYSFFFRVCVFDIIAFIIVALTETICSFLLLLQFQRSFLAMQTPICMCYFRYQNGKSESLWDGNCKWWYKSRMKRKKTGAFIQITNSRTYSAAQTC